MPHRQLVFVIPRRFRRFFQRDRPMYGVLCRCVKKAVFAFYRVGLNRPKVTPGLICHLQLFGDEVNPHVHVHALCTDGALDEEGFHRLPLGPEDLAYLQSLFQEEVFRQWRRSHPRGRQGEPRSALPLHWKTSYDALEFLALD